MMKRVDRIKIIVLVFYLFFTPSFLFANLVKISELVYDVPGSDSGREWIEVFVSGEEIDFETLRLEEAEVKHKITSFSGNKVLPTSACAVIADNPEKFLIDWPNFSGNLFDSSFSLKNTDGENLKILQPNDGDYSVLDEINYVPPEDNTDENFSLKRVGVGFEVGVPDPGVCGVFPLDDLPTPNSINREEDIINQEEKAPNFSLIIPKIFLEVRGEFEVISGGSNNFHAMIYGKDGSAIKNGQISWTFGDGARAFGYDVAHIWHYPGTYYLVVNASSGESATSFYQKINVRESNVILSYLPRDNNFGPRFLIKNPDDFKVNISGWYIGFAENFFMFPENTIILANSEIVLGEEIIPFFITPEARLFYPNGKIVEPKIKNSPAIALAVSTTNTLPDIQNKEKDNVMEKSLEIGEKKLNNEIPNLDQEVLVKNESSEDLNLEAGVGGLGFHYYFLALLGVIVAGALAFVRNQENVDDQEKTKEEDLIKTEAKSFKIVYDKNDE